MKKLKLKKSICYSILMLCCLLVGIIGGQTEYSAFPSITVEFDSNEQSVIVSGVPAADSAGIEYELRGSLYYGSERIETFCYAPNAMPYHVADKQAYIFNWKETEFLLPCSGDYQFTAYLSKITNGIRQDGPKTTITIHLTKSDESTNWGPGLPNTTVETYDLNEIKGTDKNIVIEEEEYSWNIFGQDIETVPDENLSLAITEDSESFPMTGVEEFFGDTLVKKFSIEHSGEFGFKATLNYYVGTEYAEKYANLFYVVGDGTFEFIEGGIVDENGNIAYTFTHASDYIIAITDVEYTGQELNENPEEPVLDTEMEQDTQEIIETTGDEAKADTSDITRLISYVVVTILSLALIILYAKKIKNS